jgi:hypothetical protein
MTVDELQVAIERAESKPGQLQIGLSGSKHDGEAIQSFRYRSFELRSFK